MRGGLSTVYGILQALLLWLLLRPLAWGQVCVCVHVNTRVPAQQRRLVASQGGAGGRVAKHLWSPWSPSWAWSVWSHPGPQS